MPGGGVRHLLRRRWSEKFISNSTLPQESAAGADSELAAPASTAPMPEVSWTDMNAMGGPSLCRPGADGKTQHALLEKGPDGFCIAAFPGEPPCQTDVPNLMLTIEVVPAKSKKKRKAPKGGGRKAKAKRARDEADSEDVAKDPDDEEEYPPDEEGADAEAVTMPEEEKGPEAAMGGEGGDAAAETPAPPKGGAAGPELAKQFSLKWCKKENSYSIQLKVSSKPERFQQQLSFGGANCLWGAEASWEFPRHRQFA